MVAAAARRQAEGLQPFDAFRHLSQVADLISQAFAEELGPGPRHFLRQMRRMARWGGLGLWLLEVETKAGAAPGFVWMAEGRVVGNVSLRRAASPGGWMVGNVAVHPAWRGQGIGRALTEEAVAAARARGGAWVGLEVREDNAVARGLYEGMGFKAVGTALELGRPAGSARSALDSAPLALRKASGADNDRLYWLAQCDLSQAHREVLEVRRSLYRVDWEARLNAWLEGYREHWRVAEEGGRVAGAVHVSSRLFGRWHQIEVLVRPERLEELGPRLAAHALDTLSHQRPWEAATTLAGPREALEPTFATAGFQRSRRLVQMRLLLGRRSGIASS